MSRCQIPPRPAHSLRARMESSCTSQREASARRAGSPSVVHTRTDIGPFAIEELQQRGDVELSPDPVNKVIGAWATNGRMASHCDGIGGEATPGEITLPSQHDRPSRAHIEDLHQICVLMDPSLVAGCGCERAGRADTHADPLFEFRAGRCRIGATLEGHGQLCEGRRAGDGAHATPLVLGPASRLLAAVTLSTYGQRPRTTLGGSAQRGSKNSVSLSRKWGRWRRATARSSARAAARSPCRSRSRQSNAGRRRGSGGAVPPDGRRSPGATQCLAPLADSG